MTINQAVQKIKGSDLPILMVRLGLKQAEASIATGISVQTLSALNQAKNKDKQLSIPYSLLIRLLLKYPELCPVKGPMSMIGFCDYMQKHTAEPLGDSASIMLGQQKTWYYKAIKGGTLNPTSSHLARMYMAIIENGGGLDPLRKLVEFEGLSRGMTSREVWTGGTWARNFPGKHPKYHVPADVSQAITSSSIKRLKERGINGQQSTYSDLAYLFGVTQFRMTQLSSQYPLPLQLPPNAALLARLLEKTPYCKLPFKIPSTSPEAIFTEFKAQGIPRAFTAALMMGLGGSNHKRMSLNQDSNPYTLRLGYYIVEGCKRDPRFMAKYRDLVNQEAISRGMYDNQIFCQEKWPLVSLPK